VEQIESIIAKMIEFAKSNQFDNKKAIEQIQGKKELHGPMMRVSGDIGPVAPYTKFIAVGDKTLQLTYIEFDDPVVGHARQLTVVDNQKHVLDVKLTSYIIHQFKLSDGFCPAKTPEHVCLVMETEKNYKVSRIEPSLN
jgi:hypothetical protein